MNAPTNRRTLLGGMGVASMIGVTATAATASSPSFLLPYWQEREQLIAKRQAWGDTPDCPELDALWGRRFEIERIIADATSTSLEDLKVKAALANDLLPDAEDEPSGVHPILLSIFRDVERMLLTGVVA